MGVSVIADRDKNMAVMYDDTSGATIGYTYKGVSNAGNELREFVNEWLDRSTRDYTANELNDLMMGYKIEKGLADKADWPSQMERCESILGREIVAGSF